MSSRTKAQKMMAKQLLAQAPGELTEVDLNIHPVKVPGMTRAYRNNRYTVMIFDNEQRTTHGPAIRVMVQRIDDQPIPFHWREMQKIINT